MKTLKRLICSVIWVLFLSLLATNCLAQTAFKGIELNSWKPHKKDWHFSLLMGTNRNKTVEEITDPRVAVVGTAELQKRLAKLPKGENVYWKNYAKESVPRSIVKELSEYSKKIGINLHILGH